MLGSSWLTTKGERNERALHGIIWIFRGTKRCLLSNIDLLISKHACNLKWRRGLLIRLSKELARYLQSVWIHCLIRARWAHS